MILYVRSERGAFSDRPTRKVESIHATWRDMGFEVELVSGGDVGGRAYSPEHVAAKNRRSVQLHSVPDNSGIQAPIVHSVSEFRDWRHDRALKQLLIERLSGRVPQMLWHRASRLHLAPMLVAQQLGVPYVLEWIDRLVDYRLSLFRPVALAADRRRMQHAFRVVVVSERWKRDVVAEYGVTPDKVLVSHNAVDIDEFGRDAEAGIRIRNQRGIPRDALVIGFVAKYNWHHQAHLIPEAAAHVRAATERPVYWLMVGDGPNRPQAEAAIREHDVGNVVLLQDKVPPEEVPHWLSAMDAAVVPASGGDIICPIKVPEYMASGLAPLVAASEANREVVDDGRTGLLFRSGDAESMAAAVARLAASPGLAAKLGEAARREVVARFTWHKTWGNTLREVVEHLPD